MAIIGAFWEPGLPLFRSFRGPPISGSHLQSGSPVPQPRTGRLSYSIPVSYKCLCIVDMNSKRKHPTHSTKPSKKLRTEPRKQFTIITLFVPPCISLCSHRFSRNHQIRFKGCQDWLYPDHRRRCHQCHRGNFFGTTIPCLFTVSQPTKASFQFE